MGKTILLVEDEILIAVDRAELLEQNGFHVITVINGNQAIEKVGSGEKIDLILMDINLGKGMDGTQVAEIILKEHDIPVVFLSNYTEAKVVEKTHKVKSYGYVVKDSGDTVLLASIKMAFRLYETQRELIVREEKLKTVLAEREHVEKQLLQEQDNFIKIFSAAPVGLLLLDENSIVSKSNQAICSLLLRDPAEIIGKRAGGGLRCMHSMETPDGCGFSESCPDCILRKSIESALKDGTSIHGALVNPTLLINGELQERWLSVSAEPVDLNGNRNVIVAIEDISDRKQMEEALTKALEEKDILLQELQHRVKNTLAIISGLIGLEVNRTTELQVQNVLQSMRDRISSLAKLYDMLYRSSMDMKEIRLNEYIREIALSLLNSYRPDKEQVDLQLDLDEMNIDVRRAIPIGLIVNEIITNSLKHAFNDDYRGFIRVGLIRSNAHATIEVEDNGNRLQLASYPDGSKSLGLVLVQILTEQISGKLESKIEKGTSFRITFPVGVND